MSDRTIDRILTAIFVGFVVIGAIVGVVVMLGAVGAATWAVTPL